MFKKLQKGAYYFLLLFQKWKIDNLFWLCWLLVVSNFVWDFSGGEDNHVLVVNSCQINNWMSKREIGSRLNRKRTNVLATGFAKNCHFTLDDSTYRYFLFYIQTVFCMIKSTSLWFKETAFQMPAPWLSRQPRADLGGGGVGGRTLSLPSEIRPPPIQGITPLYYFELSIFGD